MYTIRFSALRKAALDATQETAKGLTVAVETKPTDLDGDIVTGLTVIETGENIPLPPYLPEKHLKGHLQAILGVEHATIQGGKLN